MTGPGPTPAELDRLLALAGDRPLALAVIPNGDLPALARHLSGHPGVVIGQHGVDHINRADPDQPPSEFPAGSDPDDRLARLGEARRRLVAAGLPPFFFTPPWNSTSPSLADLVAKTGFSLLSAGAGRPADWAHTYLPTDVDILRWSGGVRFRGYRKVLSALGKALAVRRKAGDLDRPIGLLTHHLVHDPEAWAFLQQVLPVLDRNVDWISAADADVRRARRPDPGRDYSPDC